MSPVQPIDTTPVAAATTRALRAPPPGDREHARALALTWTCESPQTHGATTHNNAKTKAGASFEAEEREAMRHAQEPTARTTSTHGAGAKRTRGRVRPLEAYGMFTGVNGGVGMCPDDPKVRHPSQSRDLIFL